MATQECKESTADTQKVRFINTHCRQHNDISFLQRLAINLITTYEEMHWVQRLATGWNVRGSNPGGARFSAPVQICLKAHPAFCTLGIGSIPIVKRSGRGAGHSSHVGTWWPELLTKHYSCDQIEKNEMGGARSTYGGEERCMQNFGLESRGKEGTWKT
jgi:hypothetical protein